MHVPSHIFSILLVDTQYQNNIKYRTDGKFPELVVANYQVLVKNSGGMLLQYWIDKWGLSVEVTMEREHSIYTYEYS